MTLRTATAVVVVALTVAAVPICAPAQTDRSVEQIEAGRVRMPSGAEIAYRIRLLPVTSFPALPGVVVTQLDERKCMVPQTYEARTPENVVHASLERKGSDDWAVLCSVNGSTTLYVFFQSQLATPIALRHQRDSEWLGSEVGGGYGSAWGIARRAPSQIHSPKAHSVIDHDGVDDAFVEKSSTVHYYQNDSWIVIDNSN